MERAGGVSEEGRSPVTYRLHKGGKNFKTTSWTAQGDEQPLTKSLQGEKFPWREPLKRLKFWKV